MTKLVVPDASRLQPWHPSAVRIKRFQSQTPGVFTIDLGFEDPSLAREYRYAAGQFNMLYVPGVGEAAISIAGTTADGLLQHTIHRVGNVTQAIADGGVGMSLGLRGPFGTSWPIPAQAAISAQHTLAEQETAKGNQPDVTLVAGGIGLAPLRTVVHYLAQRREQYGTIHLLVGARTPQDLLYQDEYDDWVAQDIAVQTTVDRGQSNWQGKVGVVTLLLDRLRLANPQSSLVMTCGPEVMMRYVAKSALNRGIPDRNIWVTLERHMNCAIGLCGHCQLGPHIICRDGPVFRYDRVSSWLSVQEL